MSDWQEDYEEEEQWPVRYPVDTPPEASERSSTESASPRWIKTTRVDSSEVQKRLLWLLLAVEIGMALAVACVLPLLFLNLSTQEGKIIDTILTKVGGWLGLPSQVTCLVLALPLPILLLTLGFNLWWFRRIRRTRAESRSHKEEE